MCLWKSKLKFRWFGGNLIWIWEWQEYCRYLEDENLRQILLYLWTCILVLLSYQAYHGALGSSHTCPLWKIGLLHVLIAIYWLSWNIKKMSLSFSHLWLTINIWQLKCNISLLFCFILVLALVLYLKEFPLSSIHSAVTLYCCPISTCWMSFAYLCMCPELSSFRCLLMVAAFPSYHINFMWLSLMILYLISFFTFFSYKYNIKSRSFSQLSTIQNILFLHS